MKNTNQYSISKLSSAIKKIYPVQQKRHKEQAKANPRSHSVKPQINRPGKQDSNQDIANRCHENKDHKRVCPDSIYYIKSKQSLYS